MKHLHRRLERIAYHQRLLAEFIDEKYAFTKLIIKQDLAPEEVAEFLRLCDDLNKKMEEQRAEGFVYFHPLLEEWLEKLNRKLDPKITIRACLKQGIYPELMTELHRLYRD